MRGIAKSSAFHLRDSAALSFCWLYRILCNVLGSQKYKFDSRYLTNNKRNKQNLWYTKILLIIAFLHNSPLNSLTNTSSPALYHKIMQYIYFFFQNFHKTFWPTFKISHNLISIDVKLSSHSLQFIITYSCISTSHKSISYRHKLNLMEKPHLITRLHDHAIT